MAMDAVRALYVVILSVFWLINPPVPNLKYWAAPLICSEKRTKQQETVLYMGTWITATKTVTRTASCAKKNTTLSCKQLVSSSKCFFFMLCDSEDFLQIYIHTLKSICFVITLTYLRNICYMWSEVIHAQNLLHHVIYGITSWLVSRAANPK